jgi:cyclopropane-fatty-acyl-phospholipid synthase
LTAAVRILARNRDVMERMERGPASLKAPFRKFLHWTRRNTRARGRINVSKHYDLGDEFFALFLDPTMMYSCAEFDEEDPDLERASLRKIDRVCEQLELAPGDEVLEIGTGWGGFALRAASKYGCRVVTTTISGKQREHAAARVRAAGLEDRVTVLREDYRDLPRRVGRRFRKLVSIEMIEAVGHRYLDTYFRTCGDLLEPGGAMLLQAIVIADPLYESYRRSVDFIQRYVFPGGALPSVAAIRASLARVTDLEVQGLRDISAHYPPTLRCWRRRLAENLDRIRGLGYSEEFLRMWEFYFCYCEGGFLERTVGDVQMLFRKSNRPPGTSRAGA